MIFFVVAKKGWLRKDTPKEAFHRVSLPWRVQKTNFHRGKWIGIFRGCRREVRNGSKKMPRKRPMLGLPIPCKVKKTHFHKWEIDKKVKRFDGCNSGFSMVSAWKKSGDGRGFSSPSVAATGTDMQHERVFSGKTAETAGSFRVIFQPCAHTVWVISRRSPTARTFETKFRVTLEIYTSWARSPRGLEVQRSPHLDRNHNRKVPEQGYQCTGASQPYPATSVPARKAQ